MWDESEKLMVAVVCVSSSATSCHTSASGRVRRCCEMGLQRSMSSVNRSQTSQAWTRFSLSRVTMRQVVVFMFCPRPPEMDRQHRENAYPDVTLPAPSIVPRKQAGLSCVHAYPEIG